MLPLVHLLVTKGREGFTSPNGEEKVPLVVALFVLILVSAMMLFLTSWLVASLWNLTMVPLAGVKKATVLHGLLFKALWITLLL